ncbi:MAG: DUF2784 domain-containing protein [Verrucomicrobiota bacterium]
MDTLYLLLADAVLVAHFAYVAFVPGGLLLIWAGYFRRWQWVRNRWFRGAHFLAIAVVLAEALLGIECPLTTWERDLRMLGGQAGEVYQQATFMQTWVGALLFHDWEQWVFTTLYAVTFALIVLSLILVPPRWRREGA